MTTFDKCAHGIKLLGAAVPYEIAEAIREAAARDGVPMSHLIRKALLAELKARGFFRETEAA